MYKWIIRFEKTMRLMHIFWNGMNAELNTVVSSLSQRFKSNNLIHHNNHSKHSRKESIMDCYNNKHFVKLEMPKPAMFREAIVNASDSFWRAISKISEKYNLSFHQACDFLQAKGYLAWIGDTPFYDIGGDELWKEATASGKREFDLSKFSPNLSCSGIMLILYLCWLT